MNYKEILETKDYSFLKENIYLRNNIALLNVCGSHAYGLAKEDSDLDLRGILIPTKSEILFPKTLNYHSYANTGLVKGNYLGDDTDTVIYSWDNALSILISNSPSALELIGIMPEDRYLIRNEIGEIIFNNRKIFISKEVYKSYRGMAFEAFSEFQKNTHYTSESDDEKQLLVLQKFIRKVDRFNKLYNLNGGPEFKIYVEKINGEVFELDSKDLKEISEKFSLEELASNLYTGIKDIKLDFEVKSVPLPDMMSMATDLATTLKGLKQSSSNKSVVKNNSKIDKNISHAIRTLLTAIDIFKENEIIVYRENDLDLLKYIRNSEYRELDKPFEFVEKYILELLDKLKTEYERSALPDRPDIFKVAELNYNVKNMILEKNKDSLELGWI